jgi:uncharacterized membrane protein
MSETLYVLAASYDDVEDAVAAFETVKVVYDHVATSHAFDAAVVVKDESGKVHIEKKHEEPTRHGAAVGLGWGLAAGAVVALFPAVGFLGALAVGGGAGAALGAVAGHTSGGMDRDDLKVLGEVLDQGDAGLIVVYHADMADRITDAVRGARHWEQRSTNVSMEQLAADVREALTAQSG